MTRVLQGARLLASVLVSAGIFIAATTPHIAAGAPARTDIVVVRPFGPSGLRADFTVATRTSGSCWTASLATPRPDAWRCMAGNAIYDPCFAGSPTKREVACLRDPFARSVTLFSLSRSLPPRSGTPSLAGDPWGVELWNGARCVMSTGATGAVAGMRINYFCNNRAWVLGDPDRHSTIWRAHYVADPARARSGVRMIAIRRAVY